jgi:hypothetical protein
LAAQRNQRHKYDNKYELKCDLVSNSAAQAMRMALWAVSAANNTVTD